jgi:hypothetical protein
MNMLIVGKKDTLRMGLVSRFLWEKAYKAGKLKPLRMKIACGRNRYLAAHVEEVFGLPKGSVGKG